MNKGVAQVHVVWWNKKLDIHVGTELSCVMHFVPWFVLLGHWAFHSLGGRHFVCIITSQEALRKK